ncbi:MAG: type III-B CRISPR module RAMP protein Cmr1 [Candidatus Electrothrix sp. AUS4]|nr:type III-B CRISPR module RAMP protein Cmr1 [Candidatus Electrothrix sp. AUS4]
MEKIEAVFRIVTPMFMGGAKQDKAELRIPSIKAALRFWYRAVDPKYRKNEARIFGGTGDGEGQGMFLLRLEKSVTREQWNKNNNSKSFDCFNKPHPNFNRKPNHSSSNPQTWQLNGIRYLGFSLFMGEDNKARQAIPAGTEFTLRLLFKKRPDEQDRKRIVMSLWLLGHFGSLGTRSRRGFGVLSLQSLTVEKGEQWPEIKALRFAKDAANQDGWLKNYKNTLSEIKKWFSDSSDSVDANHTVFSENTKICLTDTTRESQKENRKEWEYALDTAGKIMQSFRQRWDLTTPDSDYFTVKRHICKNNDQAAKQLPNFTPSALKKAPERVGFGLPLQFRYSSLKYHVPNRRKPIVPSVLFEGRNKKHPRSASRIWVRIAEIGNKAYPVFIRMDGPLLQKHDKIKSETGRIVNRHEQPDDKILDTFWSSFSKKQEIEWGNL